MSPQKHTMAALGQMVKLILKKLIESLRRKHNIHTRRFAAASHAASLIDARLIHALRLNDLSDGMRNHSGILRRIRDCVPPSRNEPCPRQFITDCRYGGGIVLGGVCSFARTLQ